MVMEAQSYQLLVLPEVVVALGTSVVAVVVAHKVQIPVAPAEVVVLVMPRVRALPIAPGAGQALVIREMLTVMARVMVVPAETRVVPAEVARMV